MLNKLSEADFAGLRGPFESERQSPANIGTILVLAIFLQALLLFLEFFIGRHTILPYSENIILIHLGLSILLALFSILFAFPSVYIKKQKSQFFISILVSQNLFGISAYLLALIALGTNESGLNSNPSSILSFTIVTLIIGFFIFFITSIRFYTLLKQGQYGIDTKKSDARRKFEAKSYVPLAIVSGVGVLFILQYLFRTFSLQNMDIMLMIVMGILIFYAMLFVLPEQLVLLYCKRRFKSFNYSKNGKLNPMGRMDK